MLNRELQKTASSRRRGRAFGLVVCALTVTAVAMFAAMALASSSAAPTVGSATNTQFGEPIVVSAQGRTLYALSPETAHHLLCKSSACLGFWPPLTVQLEQDQAGGRVRRAWPSRDPEAQRREAPGHTRRPAPLPLLGRSRQGLGEGRGREELWRYLACNLGSDRRAGAGEQRNHALDSDDLDTFDNTCAHDDNARPRPAKRKIRLLASSGPRPRLRG